MKFRNLIFILASISNFGCHEIMNIQYKTGDSVKIRLLELSDS